MDSVKIKTVFGSETVIFNLKVLTVAQENKIRAATFDLKESEKSEKENANIISALSEYAENSKVEIIGEESSKLVEVTDYFKDLTAAKERIAHVVFRSWFVSMIPEVSFL